MKKIYLIEFRKKIKQVLCGPFFALLTIMLFGTQLNAQLSYTFTSAGVVGPAGPTQAQINNAYTGTSLSGLVTVSSGVQSFTIPVSGPYRITAYGAQGAYNGGYGAQMAGTFTLTAGTVLKIIVGQTGTTNTNGSSYVSGGGGGGSFVSSPTNVPYIVAGGGGGNGDGYSGTPVSCCLSGMQASTLTSGNPYPSGSNGGSGGNGGSCNGWTAGSGAGYYGNGVLCNGGSIAMSYTAGGAGGTGYSSSGNGGFGGGGGGSDSGVGQRGGGGGGYSGGGGGIANSGNDAAGGGGGSYNNGSSQTNTISTTTGNGKVIVELLCNISLNASTSNPTVPVICSGNSVTLTTNAISNYSWSTGSTSNSIVVSPGVTTTYSVSGTSSANCTAYNAITVTVSTGVPVLSISNPSNNICLGDTAVLTAGGALTYTWSNGVINGVPFTPTSTVNYTISGENGCGITTSVTTITVSPLQIGAISSSSIVCENNTATLTVGGASSYTWSVGSQTMSGSSIVVAPAMQTVYTVTGSIGGCIGTTSITIATKANPTVNIAGTSTMVCAGKSVTMTVNGADTYTWNPASLSGTYVVASPTAPTLYQVLGTNSLGCTTGTNWVVVTKPSPTINVSANPFMICSGGQATLSATGADAYAWTGGASTKTTVVNPSSSTVYTVTGTFTNTGCDASNTVAVTVFEPVLAISPSTSVCPGGAVTLTVGPGSGYQWSTGSSFQSITVYPTQSAVYSVSATVTSSNNLNCPASNSVQVTVYSKPTVTASATRTDICRGELSSLTAGGAGTYLWSVNNNTAAAFSFSTNIIATHSISVIGTDVNGCEDTTAVTIKVNSCTGLEEQAMITGLRFYPNPNNGAFVIESESNLELQLSSELGQLIRTVKLSGENRHQVNISDLPAGIYFITGMEGDRPVRQKIIVSK